MVARAGRRQRGIQVHPAAVDERLRPHVPREDVPLSREAVRVDQSRGHAAGDPGGAQERRQQHRVLRAVPFMAPDRLRGGRERGAQVLARHVGRDRAPQRLRPRQRRRRLRHSREGPLREGLHLGVVRIDHHAGAAVAFVRQLRRGGLRRGVHPHLHVHGARVHARNPLGAAGGKIRQRTVPAAHAEHRLAQPQEPGDGTVRLHQRARHELHGRRP